jgi:hypothetical protein
VKYGHLILYAVILLAVYGFVRPGSAAGKAMTSVTDSLAGVLGKGITQLGG